MRNITCKFFIKNINKQIKKYFFNKIFKLN